MLLHLFKLSKKATVEEGALNMLKGANIERMSRGQKKKKIQTRLHFFFFLLFEQLVRLLLLRRCELKDICTGRGDVAVISLFKGGIRNCL